MDRIYSSEVSRRLYDYLCECVGSKDVVHVRRSHCVSLDYFLGYDTTNVTTISSGSKAEGLDMASSDLDSMYLINDIHISDKRTKDAYLIFNNFVMDTEDTKPGFAQFKCDSWAINKDVFDCCIWRETELYLSSEKFKAFNMRETSSFLLLHFANTRLRFKIHGPCISDQEDNIDLAYCLRCENWIEQAQPWVERGRRWPSAKLISHTTSYGVLFVPIGCKGSPNETLEWRISFSVAEKHLIYSFSHTQLLCYALLKLLLKEIIEKHATFKGLLCSYFLKTVIFWVSEEFPVSAWQPENIIACFSNCCKRLTYCVAYEILPHYFIIENNLFENRFNRQEHSELLTFLSDQYDKGINCLLASETMSTFFSKLHFVSQNMSEIDIICCKINTSNHLTLPGNSGCGYPLNPFCRPIKSLLLGLKQNMNHFNFWKIFYLSCHAVEKQIKFDSECRNKHTYRSLRNSLPFLMLGVNADTISGWLHVATYYYRNKQFKTSLRIITYVLQKCSTDKVVYYTDILTSDHLDATEKESLLRNNFKISDIYKHHVMNIMILSNFSGLVPAEHRREMETYDRLRIKPIVYAHFLSFLCWYRLKDYYKCRKALQSLQSEIVVMEVQRVTIDVTAASFICFGIALSLFGQNVKAESCFTTSRYILTLKPDVHVVHEIDIPTV